MQQRHLKEGGVPEEVSDSMRGCGGGGGRVYVRTGLVGSNMMKKVGD